MPIKCLCGWVATGFVILELADSGTVYFQSYNIAVRAKSFVCFVLFFFCVNVLNSFYLWFWVSFVEYGSRL